MTNTISTTHLFDISPILIRDCISQALVSLSRYNLVFLWAYCIMTYQEQLKHPLWQKFKSEIFKRDKFKCRCCKCAEKTLNAHHLYYLPNTLLWDYDKDAVVTVCEVCHKSLTFELPKLSGIIAFRILSGKIKDLRKYGRLG